ncbi:hypothetical protein ACQKCH_12005 [Nubsella zeaxanthinifaciens]|uniref:hypothetical protein n=1 Tax=Nubsella zeaxanthinifaciens TaxID=392412 RepID=UPI003D01BF4F
MKKLFLFIALLCTTSLFAQEKTSDSVKTEAVKGTWDLNLDLASRYIWRGQSWGGKSPVAQLYGNYNLTDKFSLGFWTTTNFQNKNYKENEIDPKGYQEIDFIANYAFTDYFTTSLQWYYWPTVEKIEGVSNKLFDFGNTSVNTLDLMLMFDFTETKIPVWFTWSTLIAGNDYKYANDEDIKGKQNFTSYAEVGYSQDLPLGFNISPVIGAVLNNKALYYSYGDPDKVSFVNMGAKLTKEFKLSDKLEMPVWLNYTHNGAKRENAIPEGSKDLYKNYFVFGVSFKFSK